MQRVTERVIDLIWRAAAEQIRRGYAPQSLPPATPLWLSRGVAGEVVGAETPRLPPPSGERFAFVWPTVLRSDGGQQLRRLVDAALVQLADAARDSGVELVLVIGLQWLPGQAEHARAELQRVLAAVAPPAAVHLLGLLLPAPRKSRTLNAVFSAIDTLGLGAVGWIDDDVELAPRCLSRLVQRFRQGGAGGAVGATKVAHRRPEWASRLLFRAKQSMQTAENYPHGCCILVDAAVVRRGIPERYVSDDGFVCFELLAPSRPDPLDKLQLVPEAECHYTVGAPRGRLLLRLRRLQLNHHVFLADYPPDVGRYYVRHMLFAGLWPIAPWDRSAPAGAALVRWQLKAVHFGLFCAIGAELALRGRAGRPLREIPWAGSAI
jgi:hypothetical protein